MTASLYQRGSLVGPPFSSTEDMGWLTTSALHSEHVRDLIVGIEAHVVARARPCESRVCDQIVYDVLLVHSNSHLFDRNVHHRGLHVARVEVHGDKDVGV